MDQKSSPGSSQDLTYPYPLYYSQGFPPEGVDHGYIPPNMIPLIEQYRLTVKNDQTVPSQPMPSYKEVKEELSEALCNKSRKEKRKMIKNKRNRMKRQKQQQQLDNSTEKNTEEENQEEEAMLQKQARQWKERNQMMEEDRYSKEIQPILKERREQEERKEKEYLKSIAREVAKRNSKTKEKVQKPDSTITDKQNKPIPEYCLSYLRTGACRYGYRCKHPHCIPKKSRGLLFHNMFQLSGEVDTDDSLSAYLEYTEEEIEEHFRDFYFDLVQELKKFGDLQYLLVSSNYVPYLRGNVYAVWKTREEGEKALQGLQGRYYGGRELDIEYLPESVMCWKYGLCKDYLKKECDRGKECNYLHFYINPNYEYMIEKEKSRSSSRDRRSHSRRSRSHSHSRERSRRGHSH